MRRPSLCFLTRRNRSIRLLPAQQHAGLQIDKGKLVGSPEPLNLFTLEGDVVRLDLRLRRTSARRCKAAARSSSRRAIGSIRRGCSGSRRSTRGDTIGLVHARTCVVVKRFFLTVPNTHLTPSQTRHAAHRDVLRGAHTAHTDTNTRARINHVHRKSSHKHVTLTLTRITQRITTEDAATLRWRRGGLALLRWSRPRLISCRLLLSLLTLLMPSFSLELCCLCSHFLDCVKTHIHVAYVARRPVAGLAGLRGDDGGCC